jgi:hypothetical protein
MRKLRALSACAAHCTPVASAPPRRTLSGHHVEEALRQYHAEQNEPVRAAERVVLFVPP